MNLDGLTIKSLREVAEKFKIEHAGLGKVELRDAITAHMAGVAAVEKPEVVQKADVFQKPDFAPEDQAHGVFVQPAPKPERTAQQRVTLPTAVEGRATPDEVRKAVLTHTQRGLVIEHLDDESWHFKRGLREDSGTMRQPLPNIVACASKLVAPVILPDLEQDTPGHG